MSKLQVNDMAAADSPIEGQMLIGLVSKSTRRYGNPAGLMEGADAAGLVAVTLVGALMDWGGGAVLKRTLESVPLLTPGADGRRAQR